MDVPQGLWRRHCEGCAVGCCAGPCAGATNALFEGSERKLLFVGGGISSIEGAKIARSRGEELVIVESLPVLGGIWSTAANPESRIQVDPVAFRPIEDDTPVVTPSEDPFSTIYPDRMSVLTRLAHDVEHFDLARRVVHCTKVLRFEVLSSGLIRVHMRRLTTSTSSPGLDFSNSILFHRSLRSVHATRCFGGPSNQHGIAIEN